MRGAESRLDQDAFVYSRFSLDTLEKRDKNHSHKRSRLTMAPRKGATLSAMVDPMSEDEIAHSEEVTLDENHQPAKRRANARPTATASKVTKPKAPARRTSGASLLTNTKSKAKRKALTERNANEADGNETEEVETFDEPTRTVTTGDDTTVIAAKPVKKRQAKPKATSTAQKTTANRKRAAEAQPQHMEIDNTVLEDDDPTPRAIARRQAPAASRSRSISRQPEPIAGTYRRRAGSASSTERDGGAGLRRKLGDITKKFENLDLKYKSLKEIAVTEAQNSLEKLRKAGEKRAQGESFPFDGLIPITREFCLLLSMQIKTNSSLPSNAN